MMGSNRNANPYGASSEAERCLNDTGIQFTRMSRADMNTAAAMFNQQVGRMKFPAGEVQVTPGNFVHFPGGYPHASVGSDNRIDVQFTKGPNGSGGRVKLERF